MIRLVLLTVAALVAVAMIWGDPGARRAPVAETAQTGKTVPVAEVAPAAQVTPAVAPGPVAQTEPQAQRLPGPALRPSPEYAQDAPVETAAAPAGEGAVLYVTGNRVNFRAGPSADDAVVGALLRGSPVRATGPARGGWVPLIDAEGRAGFMSEKFLSADRP